jgi:hypothetical protein
MFSLCPCVRVSFSHLHKTGITWKATWLSMSTVNEPHTWSHAIKVRSFIAYFQLYDFVFGRKVRAPVCRTVILTSPLHVNGSLFVCPSLLFILSVSSDVLLTEINTRTRIPLQKFFSRICRTLMEAKRPLPCSQELNVRTTKEREKTEIHRSVLAYTHSHQKSTSQKNNIFFIFLCVEWRNAHRRTFYHIADHWLPAGAEILFVKYTAVGAFRMKIRKGKFIQISCLFNFKYHVSLSVWIKFQNRSAQSRDIWNLEGFWAKFNKPSSFFKTGRQKWIHYTNQ